MAFAGIREIKNRIKSVESTAQITKAMELVASSKLKKAKERAEKSRPFFDTLYETICEIAQSNTDFTSVYTTERDQTKNSLLVITAGDKGLAGGYNANIFKLAAETISENKKKGINTKIIAIGKKACDHFSKINDVTVLYEYSDIAEDLTPRKTKQIEQQITKLYADKEIDEVILFFTQFVTALNQQPVSLRILPLSMLKSDDTAPQKEIIEYEPSPEAVFDYMIPAYIQGVLYGGIVESFASEQGARRTAMESANDNAKEMIDALSLQYNRARQSGITQEITEIVSGANAL